jgi:hypothetical protein
VGAVRRGRLHPFALSSGNLGAAESGWLRVAAWPRIEAEVRDHAPPMITAAMPRASLLHRNVRCANWIVAPWPSIQPHSTPTCSPCVMLLVCWSRRTHSAARRQHLGPVQPQRVAMHDTRRGLQRDAREVLAELFADAQVHLVIDQPQRHLRDLRRELLDLDAVEPVDVQRDQPVHVEDALPACIGRAQHFQRAAVVAAGLERVVQPAHALGSPQVDAVLRLDALHLVAGDEGETAQMLVQVGQREFSFVAADQIGQPQAREVADDDVARQVALPDAGEIIERLVEGPTQALAT